MALRLAARHEQWPLERPFSISRGTKTVADVVAVELSEGQISGHGECVPYGRYDESIAGVLESMASVRDALQAGVDRAKLAQSLAALLPPGAARNAVDCALWDLEAKQTGIPAWQRASVTLPGHVVTARTVSVAAPAAMAAEARDYGDAPLLKLKLGGSEVVESVRAVRDAAPRAELIVDANEAWSPGGLAAWLPPLAELGVTLIEQPLPAGEDAVLADIERHVPVCADESCHTAADLERLVGRYDVVNIKLDKTGGLTAALELAEASEALGFGLMLGCMVGTSLAMAPALLLAARARWVDLDGPLLLADDREPGVVGADGRLGLSADGGWGAAV